jgi:hypothetical protein
VTLPEPARRYLGSKETMPFFLFAGDEQYGGALNELRALGLKTLRVSKCCGGEPSACLVHMAGAVKTLRVSECCGGEDRPPDMDGLIESVKNADANTLVLGLGEYLGLRGPGEAEKWLGDLKSCSSTGGRVVLLLRGLRSQLDALKRKDPRFNELRWAVMDETACRLSFVVAPPSAGVSAPPGLKVALAALEDGQCGEVTVRTAIDLGDSLFTVKKIDGAHEGVKLHVPDFAPPASCGSEAQWGELLAALNREKGSLDAVFDRHEFGDDTGPGFYERISGETLQSWLYFIYLKCSTDARKNGYLRLVLDRTNSFGDFVSNVMNGIIEVNHDDRRFPAFYAERKTLAKGFPESLIAEFIAKNRKYVAESIYKLTDNTGSEREEIIAWLSRHGEVPEIKDIYPRLADYLKKYIFKTSEIADLLTDYFHCYKRQKLSNRVEPDFLARVEDLAKAPHKFDRLPSRDEAVEKLDADGTHLYWLDALGAEYLSFIEAMAQRHGLSIKIHIARAKPPTITDNNRKFFDEWQGPKENAADRSLDQGVKHKPPSTLDPENMGLPVHLAYELDVIEKVMDKAAEGLRRKKHKRFVLASDHGASRLAALTRGETHETEPNNGGYHSGRCCAVFPHGIPTAVEANGHLALACYGRFKGGRLDSVEVHGGASLEEIVVPVVELALMDADVRVQLVGDAPKADHGKGTEIELFFDSPVDDVSIVLDGRLYTATMKDRQHHTVRLPDVKRARECEAKVYSGDTPLGSVAFKVRGSGGVDAKFDEWFGVGGG